MKVGGDLEGWRGTEGKGTRQGRRRKNKWACVIPPASPFKTLRVRGWGDYTCSPVLSSFPCFIPLHPTYPSSLKISPYLHLNSWIQLSTLTLLWEREQKIKVAFKCQSLMDPHSSSESQKDFNQRRIFSWDIGCINVDYF